MPECKEPDQSNLVAISKKKQNRRINKPEIAERLTLSIRKNQSVVLVEVETTPHS